MVYQRFVRRHRRNQVVDDGFIAKWCIKVSQQGRLLWTLVGFGVIKNSLSVIITMTEKVFEIVVTELTKSALVIFDLNDRKLIMSVHVTECDV